MSKWSTIIDGIKVEQCAICGAKVEAMLVHLALHHKGVTQVGEIFWLNRHEAIYKGRHYGAPKSQVRSSAV